MKRMFTLLILGASLLFTTCALADSIGFAGNPSGSSPATGSVTLYSNFSMTLTGGLLDVNNINGVPFGNAYLNITLPAGTLDGSTGNYNYTGGTLTIRSAADNSVLLAVNFSSAILTPPTMDSGFLSVAFGTLDPNTTQFAGALSGYTFVSGTALDVNIFTNYHWFTQTWTGQMDQAVVDTTANPAVPTVPEPGSIFLMATGVLGLAGSIRRKLSR